MWLKIISWRLLVGDYELEGDDLKREHTKEKKQEWTKKKH